MITASHLRAARAALGLSQAEVAAGAGVSQLQVSRAEIRGVENVRAGAVANLVTFFDQKGITFGANSITWPAPVSPPPAADAPEA